MFFKGCHKERREATFKKYRAEIVLLLALVVFYLTLIIFTFVSMFLRHVITKRSPEAPIQMFCRQCESFNNRELVSVPQTVRIIIIRAQLVLCPVALHRALGRDMK